MELETRLLEAFVSLHPAQAARAIEQMPTSDAAEVMTELPVDVLAGVLPSVAPVSAANALQLVPVRKAVDVLSATPRNVGAAILRTMGRDPRSTIMESMSDEAGRALSSLLRYSEGSAGALMDPQVLPIPEASSVAEALERLRKNANRSLYYVYVVADDQKLVGVANLRELMAARPEQHLGLVAVRRVASLPAAASWKAIVAHPAWSRFHALPVVEADGRFLGVIRYEVIRELERSLVETQLEDHGFQTAAALGELYGLGLRGLVGWAASALLGPSDTTGGSR